MSEEKKSKKRSTNASVKNTKIPDVFTAEGMKKDVEKLKRFLSASFAKLLTDKGVEPPVV